MNVEDMIVDGAGSLCAVERWIKEGPNTMLMDLHIRRDRIPLWMVMRESPSFVGLWTVIHDETMTDHRILRYFVRKTL